jgi:hypothetical protein
MYKGTMSHFKFLDDPNFIRALEYVDRPKIRKFELGGDVILNGYPISKTIAKTKSNLISHTRKATCQITCRGSKPIDC